MVHVKPLYNDNKSLPAGGVRVFSKKIEHLEPGTTYYFFPYDIDHNITYPVQKFTTVGTKSQGVQSSNNHLLLMPDGASFALEIWGTTNQEKTNMTLHGKVVPLRTGPLTLKIAWGQTSSSLSTTATVLTRNKLSVGDPSRDALIRKQLEFSYTFTGITPGTQYFFQLTDTTHNVKYPIKSFTVTNSVVGGASQASDETTALMNSVIENEPKINNPYEKTGLVPCGKKGQAMCTWKDFIKLIGNVLDYVLILIIPIIAIMCVYTGAQIIIYRDRAEELSLAKSRMFKLLIGVAVILLSWLAVSWLFKVLQVPKDYILLDIID
jgi:hypothetical protein